MPSTPVQGLRYPSATDPADGPVALRNLAEDAEQRVVMRFPHAAERDARLPEPVPGMVSWLDRPGRLEFFHAGAWRDARTQTYAAVDDLPSPVIIAHRGGANIAPENTMEAFRAAAALGVAVEPDCWLTADRVLACIHDATLDRTTTGGASIFNIDAHAFVRQIVDAPAWFGGGWPNTAPPLLEDVVRAIGGRAVLVPEAKGGADTGEAIAALIARYGLERSAIVQSQHFDALPPAVAAGIPAMFVTFDLPGAPDPDTMLLNGVGWLGIDLDENPAAIAPYLDAGIKVVVHTVNRHHDRDRWLTAGVHGFFTDEPGYTQLDPNTYRRNMDPFGGQTWPHGFMRNPGGGRGLFTPRDWWSPGPNNPGFWLQGWACPVPSPATFGVRLDIRYDSIGNDATRWPSVFFAQRTDHPFDDAGSATNNGYHALFRANGQIALFRIDNGALTAGPAVNLPALGNGSVITVLVQVDATQVRVQRNDQPQAPLIWADTTHRGPYWFLGHNGTGGHQYSFRLIDVFT